MTLAPLSRSVDLVLEASVVGSFSRIGSVVRSQLDGWRPVTDLDGSGRTVLVTGANSGLGYATARALLRAGAAVRLLVRTSDKADATIAQLRDEVGADIDVAAVTADLTDLGAVDAAADALLARDEPLDAIVHNAGAMFPDRQLTGDGLERTYQVHVVAPHRLTIRLLERLAASTDGRVVTVTSGGMYAEKLDAAKVDSPGGYRPTVAYARAKRAQVTLTAEWARRLAGRGIDFHVVHPGWALTPGVETSLPGFRKVVGPILRDADQGADTVVWAVLSDQVRPSGRLWHDRRPRSPHKVPWTWPATGEADRLWRRVHVDARTDPATLRTLEIAP